MDGSDPSASLGMTCEASGMTCGVSGMTWVVVGDDTLCAVHGGSCDWGDWSGSGQPIVAYLGRDYCRSR